MSHTRQASDPRVTWLVRDEIWIDWVPSLDFSILWIKYVLFSSVHIRLHEASERCLVNHVRHSNHWIQKATSILTRGVFLVPEWFDRRYKKRDFGELSGRCRAKKLQFRNEKQQDGILKAGEKRAKTLTWIFYTLWESWQYHLWSFESPVTPCADKESAPYLERCKPPYILYCNIQVQAQLTIDI